MIRKTHVGIPEIIKSKKGDESLISDWVIAKLEDGSVIEAYFHIIHGWMTKGGSFGDFIYGYIPLTKNVVSWHYK